MPKKDKEKGEKEEKEKGEKEEKKKKKKVKKKKVQATEDKEDKGPEKTEEKEEKKREEKKKEDGEQEKRGSRLEGIEKRGRFSEKRRSRPPSSMGKPNAEVNEIDIRVAEIALKTKVEARDWALMMGWTNPQKFKYIDANRNVANDADDEKKWGSATLAEFLEGFNGPPLDVQPSALLIMRSKMKSKAFTKDFVKEGGVGLLLQIMGAARENRKEMLHTATIKTLRAGCNAEPFRAELSTDASLSEIVLSLSTSDASTLDQLLQMFIVFCSKVEDGQKKMARCLTFYAKSQKEKRYGRLLDLLRTSKSVSVKENCMSLILELLGSLENQADISSRVEKRKEFLQLGILEAFLAIRAGESTDTLLEAMKTFEEGQKKDEEEIQQRLVAQGHELDLSDPMSIFKALLQQVEGDSVGLNGLRNVMLSMMSLPPRSETGKNTYQLVDKLLYTLNSENKTLYDDEAVDNALVLDLLKESAASGPSRPTLEMEKEMKNLKGTVEMMQAERRVLDATKNGLTVSIKEMEGKYSSLQKEEKSLLSNLESEKEKNAAFAVKVEQGEVRCADLEKRFKEESTKLNTEIAEKNKQLEESAGKLEESSKQLQEKVGELEESEKQFKEKAGELEESKKQFQEKQGELEEKKKQLQEKVSREEENSGKLEESKKQLQDKETQLEESKKQLQEKEREVEESKKQLQEQAGELEEKDGKLEESKKQLQEKEGELGESKKKLQEKEEELGESKKQLQEKEGELEQNKKKLQEKAGQLEESKKQLQEKEGQLEESKKELQEKAGELEEKAGKLEESKKQLQEKEGELDKSKRELQEKEGQLEGKIEVGRKGHQELENEKQKLSEEKKLLEEDKKLYEEKKKKEAEEKEESHKNIEKELERKKNELAEGQESLEKEKVKLQAEFEKLKEQKKEEEEIEKKKKELAEKEEKMGVELEMLENSTREIQATSEKIGERESEVGGLEDEKARLVTLEEKLQGELEELKENQQALESDKNFIEKEKLRIQELMTSLHEQKEIDIEDIHAEKIEELEQILTEKDNKISDLSQEIGELKKEGEGEKTEVAKLKDNLAKMEESLVEKEKERAQEEAKRKEAEEKVLPLPVPVPSGKGKSKKKLSEKEKTKISELSQEIENLKKEGEGEKVQITKLKENVQKLENSLAAKEKERAEEEKKRKEAEEKALSSSSEGKPPSPSSEEKKSEEATAAAPPPPPPGPAPGAPPPPPGPAPGAPPPPPGPAPGAPPPPPGGGPGGPPPLPMMKAPPKIVSRKIEFKRDSKTKMQGLHWVKLPNSKLKGTLWETKPTFDASELDLLGLEDHFTTEETKKEEASEPKEKKKKVVQLIDPRRSQNLSIFLQTLRRSPAEIRNDIMTVNWEVLKLDVVKQLRGYVPEKDELTLIREWRESNSLKPQEDQLELPLAEIYMEVVSSVNMLAERLQIVETKLNHGSLLGQVQQDASCLEKGLSEIKSSKKLERIMELVLHIGNYINTGTNRGKCDGFKISTLRRLVDFRSKKNPKMNLLMYIHVYCTKKYPDLLDLGELSDAVKEASKINTVFISSSITSICNGMDFIKKTLPKLGSKESDKCVELMEPWVKENEEAVQSISEYWAKIKRIHDELCARLGEDPKSYDPQEMCENISGFLQQLAAVQQLMEKDQQRREEEKRREEARLKKLAEKQAKEGVVPDEDVVDDIFENLKAGRRSSRRREKDTPTKEENDLGDTLTPSTRKQRNWDEEFSSTGSRVGKRDRENGGSRLGGEGGRRRRNLLDQAAEVLGEKNGQESCDGEEKGEFEKEVRAKKRERILETAQEELKEGEGDSGETKEEQRRKERAARRKALLS